MAAIGAILCALAFVTLFGCFGGKTLHSAGIQSELGYNSDSNAGNIRQRSVDSGIHSASITKRHELSQHHDEDENTGNENKAIQDGRPEMDMTSHDKADDIHGGIKMGVKNEACDDGIHDLIIDWDDTADYEYTCQPSEPSVFPPQYDENITMDCLPKDEIPKPIHKCYPSPILYDDIPPRGGTHRPLWPVYGEYLYCPPQRWVHTLEHGAVVFLYHPCADAQQIEAIRSLARSCLRKHIITPYRPLGLDRPFAAVTWGCKVQSSYINRVIYSDFIRATAQRTAESSVSRDGQYDAALLTKAHLVSDDQESKLCPFAMYDYEHMNRTLHSSNALATDA